jgi:EpsI family protein
MRRRDLLIGSACVAAAGASYALKPRRNVALLEGGDLAEIVPAVFGDWTSQAINDPLAVNGVKTLSAQIYNQLVVRVYSNARTGVQVLMLLAYGGRQTDELQLHRPEVCYPAFGFNLTRNEPADLAVGHGVTIPTRRLAAEGPERQEGVIYWSRIGEYLPATGGQQREDRLAIALQGIVPDGLLSRFSVIADDPAEAWREIEAFVPALLGAIAPGRRKVLVGSERAARMGQAPAGPSPPSPQRLK